ncbi:hypothetical protein GF336_00260 [Candidatus Woesearchaeota archaeon]|nr:hypothetical protein [Candidatus Woesearchaeota archaeon]
MRTKMFFGLEIECLYNPKINRINQSDYHDFSNSSCFNSYFYAERDSSIEYCDFNGDCTSAVELISIPLEKDEIKEALSALKESLNIEKKNTDFSDIIGFNNSTGAHIHVGIYKDSKKRIQISDNRGFLKRIYGKEIKLSKVINLRLLKDINHLIIKRVKTELPHIYNSWISQFYRNYAKELDFPLQRDMSWNLKDYDRLEFRSFNLMGVKTWNDLEKIYEIAIDTIYSKMKEVITRSSPFKERNKIVIEPKDGQDERFTSNILIEKQPEEVTINV